MSQSRRLIRRLAALAGDPAPADVRALAKLHILDAIGVGLAASAGPAGRVYSGTLDTLGSAGAATVLGRRAGAAPADAALANGGMIHALEFDDTHMGSIVHGSATLLPAALAAAQASGASGARLLAAYIQGWEMLVRIGLASPGGFQREGFQVTVTGGVFAAAAIGCELFGADESCRVAALGIALSQAGGVFEFLTNGSTVKSLHPGWGAHAGLTATALAINGLTGPETAFEGRIGLFRRFGGGDAEAAFDAQIETLGRQWHLRDAAFKFHPCCHYIHPYLTALDRLEAQGVVLRELSGMTCEVAPGAAPIICDPWQRRLAPQSAHEMRYSLPVVLALRSVEGRLDIGSFERPPSDAVLAFARRIEWRPLEPNRFPDRFEAVIEAIDASRTPFRIAVDDVDGGPRYPASPDRVLAKFRDNAGRRGDASAVETLAEAVMAMEELECGVLAQALARFAA